ncbi:MAG: hypothetical protein LBS81_03770 [Endomicrobium sp.]|jgi:hypothetical protein|nr:hypothetical protein [Endomicrobium sp.]
MFHEFTADAVSGVFNSILQNNILRIQSVSRRELKFKVFTDKKQDEKKRRKNMERQEAC